MGGKKKTRQDVLSCLQLISSKAAPQMSSTPKVSSQTRPQRTFGFDRFFGSPYVSGVGHILFSTSELFNLNYSSAKAAVPQV